MYIFFADQDYFLWQKISDIFIILICLAFAASALFSKTKLLFFSCCIHFYTWPLTCWSYVRGQYPTVFMSWYIEVQEDFIWGSFDHFSYKWERTHDVTYFDNEFSLEFSWPLHCQSALSSARYIRPNGTKIGSVVQYNNTETVFQSFRLYSASQ